MTNLWAVRRADERAKRLWALGGITRPSWADAIRAETDWAWVLAAPSVVRDFYLAFCDGSEPLSDIHADYQGEPLHITRETLRTLWRLRQRAL